MEKPKPEDRSQKKEFLRPLHKLSTVFSAHFGNTEKHLSAGANVATIPVNSVALTREDAAELKSLIHQLESDNAALQTQIAQGAARLSRSEEKNRSVVENAIDGIVILIEGCIQYCNPQMLLMLGRSLGEVQDEPLETFFAPGTRLELQEWNVKRSAGEAVSTRHENAIIHKDGRRIVVEIHASEMLYEDQPAVLAFVRDMTRRKQMEVAEREALEVAESLRSIGVALSASLDFDQVLDKTFDFIKRVVPYDSCCILLVEGRQVRPVRFRGYEMYGKKAVEQIPTIRFDIDSTQGIAHIINTKQPLIVRDTRSSKGWISPLGFDQIRSWIGAPLVAHDEVIAIFSLDKCLPRFYSTRHAERLALYAGQAALALENARLYGAVQDNRLHLEGMVAERTAELKKVLATLEQRVAERTQELAALYNVASIATAFTDLDQILSQSLQVILATLGGKAGAIHLLDEKDELSILIIPEELDQEMKTEIENLPRCETIWTRMIQHGQPVLIQNLGIETGIDPASVSNLTTASFCVYIGSPIHGTKRILGAFSIIGNSEQSFSREDTVLLSAITDQIGIAVENAHLRKESERTAVAEERQRLARDLHDSVSQLLYSQVLYANASKKFIQSGNPDLAADYLTQLSVSAQQALKEMRLMIYELRPSMLEREGLAGALRVRLETVERRSGMQANLTAHLESKLSPTLEDDLYRMAQEALNNVLKHALAKVVNISLTISPGSIIMEISDDGKGFDPQTVREGIGLSSLRERTSRLGGRLEIASSPGAGTSVRVVIQEIA
jgi:PAS domain S-box-containing protein